jgi:serine/threonine protein kinase
VEVGRYEILRRIAKGGMAELYLARQKGIEGFEKLVVLKRILPELAGDAEFVGMFLDEARLAAGLHHSNVVQVYDIGSADDGYFFAMEYLHGEDLRFVMRSVESAGETVPLPHALSIGLGVCAGLHYAHERTGADGRPLGIVHRDVSPHNVFVTWDGGVKVLDFGIAKAARRLSETRTGALKGKIQYMSPEQCTADPLDRRSDVFAIGILLWELAVGRRLYSGKSDLAIMKLITEREAPNAGSVSNCPRELSLVIAKALARRPQDRFQTAEALQLALEELARDARLALSPVGLSHWIKDRFGRDADAWAAAQKSGMSAITQYAASRLERRPALDDSENPLDDDSENPRDYTDNMPSTTPVSRPHTRPIAADPPPKKKRRGVTFAAIAIAVAAGGSAIGLKLAQPHPPLPKPAPIAVPTPAPPSPAPVVVAAPEEPPKPVIVDQPIVVAHPHKKLPIHHHPEKKRRVDLDAPLPPK